MWQRINTCIRHPACSLLRGLRAQNNALISPTDLIVQFRSPVVLTKCSPLRLLGQERVSAHVRLRIRTSLTSMLPWNIGCGIPAGGLRRAEATVSSGGAAAAAALRYSRWMRCATGKQHPGKRRFVRYLSALHPRGGEEPAPASLIFRAEQCT